MYADIDCEPVVRQVKPWGHGRTVSVELPADKLVKLAEWALDNGIDSFSMISEKLHFRTTHKPKNAAGQKSNNDPVKTSKEVIEVIDIDQEMKEAPPTNAFDAKLTMVNAAALSVSVEPMETELNAPVTLPATFKPTGADSPSKVSKEAAEAADNNATSALSLDEIVARAKVSSALASFNFGPVEAAKLTMDGDAIKGGC